MSWSKEHVLSATPELLPFVVLAGAVGLLLIWVFRRQQKVWLIDQMPGPKGLPILGSALFVSVEPVELFKRVLSFCEYGPVMRVWIANVAYAIISGAEAVEVILSSQKHIDKSRDYTFLYPWLGTGLLTSTGTKWHSRRKLLTPAFHFKILEDFLDVFNRQSARMAQRLSGKADGKPFDIFPYVTLCALDIICETAMGNTVNAQDNSESEYVKAIYRIVHIIQMRMSRPWLQPNVLFKALGYAKEHDACLRTLHGFSQENISRRRQALRDGRGRHAEAGADDLGRKTRLAFLDLLLEYSEDGAKLSDEDIREEVDTFMFEGHDTTTAAVNWALYLLGHNPEIQDRLQEELDGIFGDSDRPITMSDLREMKYTENCIKEALRIYPSVPIIGRELKEDITVGKYHIPAGVTAMIYVYRLHRDPEQFPNPEVFDPDRFLPENCKTRHPYAYVPFSAGPRNCIGQKFALMEEKVMISHVLRKFRVESVTPRNDLELVGEIILRPFEGIRVKLVPRRDAETAPAMLKSQERC
ncbi:cytochrome P450 4C1 isoform X1 [Penaeus vannamei]|uniref:cytochrome P450 4C1 isoform X1 n=1 Tax=Penaeus vannamei TaxID=6689 RepID=UPI00387FA34F